MVAMLGAIMPLPLPMAPTVQVLPPSSMLSPAAASWGQFDNYEQRGEIFKDIVNKL